MTKNPEGSHTSLLKPVPNNVANALIEYRRCAPFPPIIIINKPPPLQKAKTRKKWKPFPWSKIARNPSSPYKYMYNIMHIRIHIMSTYLSTQCQTFDARICFDDSSGAFFDAFDIRSRWLLINKKAILWQTKWRWHGAEVLVDFVRVAFYEYCRGPKTMPLFSRNARVAKTRAYFASKVDAYIYF